MYVVYGGKKSRHRHTRFLMLACLPDDSHKDGKPSSYVTYSHNPGYFEKKIIHACKGGATSKNCGKSFIFFMQNFYGEVSKKQKNT